MNETQDIRTLKPQDFAMVGLNDVAYVKSVEVDGTMAFAIHAADGTQMAVLVDRETAFAAVRQHDMEPMSVH